MKNDQWNQVDDYIEETIIVGADDRLFDVVVNLVPLIVLHVGIMLSMSTVRTEVLAGASTFLAMAYIIVVNPAILKAAGLPVGASTVATILVAAVGSILMGVYANRPIAVAPYMGENAFIAFGLAALGVTWQQRLGTVFVSGVLFLVITLVGLRGWLARSISTSLKHSFAAGIGLFLAFIGLTETGIVTTGTGGEAVLQ